MSRKSFVPHDCIAALNNIKKGFEMRGLPFTIKQLRESLKGCGLPYNNNFLKVFKESGILKDAGRGKYLFSDDKPIYVGTLQTIKHKYSELRRKYSEIRRQKAKEDTPPEPEEKANEFPLPEDDPNAMIQFAIDLLKEQGYQIFAPVATIYKKL